VIIADSFGRRMRDSWARSSTLADSRLTDPRVATGALAGIVLLFAAGMIVLSRNTPDDPSYWRVFGIGWLLAVGASIPAVALLVYLDRRDPEPWWTGTLAYFWGAVVATGLGLLIRTEWMGRVSETFDETAGMFDTSELGVQIVDPSVIFSWLDTALLAPVVEEGIKAVALLIVVALLPSLINGVRDGVVYGALVGLGFAVAETAMYVGNTYLDAGFAPFMGQLVPRFVFGGINGHAIYSALFGAGIGMAIEIEKGRWVRQTLLIVGGFLLAVSAHAMSNGFGPTALVMLTSIFSIDPGLLTIGELWWLSAGKVLMTTGWAYVVLAYLLVRSGTTELGVIKTELQEETEPTVLAAELPLIESEGMWRMRRIPWLPRRVSVRLVRQQNRVAFRREHLIHHGRPLDGDQWLGDLRTAVASLRGVATTTDRDSDHGE
jgi:RsiW-degrading membrane proteinase PrsW (M82 family)